MKFNSKRLKYYEANPFRDEIEEKFVKNIKQQKKKEKNKKEIALSNYEKKDYRLAIDIVTACCDYGVLIYEDPSSIAIFKVNENSYGIRCDNGLLTEDEIARSFENYDDLIDYINQFYDYNALEEHYKNKQMDIARSIPIDYHWRIG